MKSLDWWEQVLRDIETAEYLFEGKRYKECSFFCQQAVEKALKSILLKTKKEIVKVHDLVKLGRLVDLPEEFEKECDQLTGVYIDTRYPDTGSSVYTSSEASDDIRAARKLLQWVEKNI
ncbi:HEPN domain-containing protein [Candidatus Woesearchaeota archaeon]|nr:HEPN domain-containing protein [Candidatus Woesearchaeota archaeon]